MSGSSYQFKIIIVTTFYDLTKLWIEFHTRLKKNRQRHIDAKRRLYTFRRRVNNKLGVYYVKSKDVRNQNSKHYKK